MRKLRSLRPYPVSVRTILKILMKSFLRVNKYSSYVSGAGSAASLDQNNDQGSANDPHGNNHESDIEIMSNPSQSSIEVLEIHGR